MGGSTSTCSGEVSAMLIGAFCFIITMFYLGNNKDHDIRRHFWRIQTYTVLIGDKNFLHDTIHNAIATMLSHLIVELVSIDIFSRCVCPTTDRPIHFIFSIILNQITIFLAMQVFHLVNDPLLDNIKTSTSGEAETQVQTTQ